ncbi:MAG: hypothetical protein P1U86_16375 [Verrucomicrobiales bacterium]|nr:hypothetical protein [Verrucomicrobiales bacterium]
MKTYLLLILFLITLPACSAENSPPATEAGQASVSTTIDENGAGKIVVEARGELPKPPVFYSSDITNNVTVRPNQIDSEILVKVKILQGEAKTVSYWTHGLAEVVTVEGGTVAGWAVRWDDKRRRFIDVTFKESGKPVAEHSFKIRLKEEIGAFPAMEQVTNLGPANDESASFTQIVNLSYTNGVEGQLKSIKNFLALNADEGVPSRYQTDYGGTFQLQLNRSGTTPSDVELTRFRLSGELDQDAKFGTFRIEGLARVAKAGATVTILRGAAVSLSSVPANPNYRVRLETSGKQAPYYELVFEKPGEWPVELEFVGAVTQDKEWSRILFTVAAGAVSPVSLDGFPEAIEFRNDSTVQPVFQTAKWNGFIPASGDFHIAWKALRRVGEGKLFFSTSAKIDTTVSAGLLRQNHAIDYQILQGELDELLLDIDGPGEVLDVVAMKGAGTQVAGWTVEGDEKRFLRVRLSEAIKKAGGITVVTQLPIDAFPIRAAVMRIIPRGVVRHSGFMRISNRGSVRLEPAATSGLTQLAPEQYPGEALEARQVFVYRFPSAEHEFEVAVDRIQPVVNVSERVVYKLAETDRIIDAAIELDVREAPVREWDFLIPDDYSVVAVSGASVADYIVASAADAGRRNLKVIFNADVSGRQLVTLQLEKNLAAVAGDWVLPRIDYPGAESVRGDIGIAGEPGFRIASGETDLLAERPLSYFPDPTPYLQQAFRIRERGWSATMQVEVLEKSIQADVFHLYSLSEGTAYGSALINYFVTGAPVSELSILVPEDLGNVTADGKDIRSFRQEGDTLKVSLHQPVIGSYTLLITFEEKLDTTGGVLQPGRVKPLEVEGERGYLQIVSLMQVKMELKSGSEGLLKLDALELPAEFRLLSSAPTLGAWQYTERPFDLSLNVDWFETGMTVTQVVEFSEINSRISPDGEWVSDVIYYVKSRGRRAFKVELPDAVRLWAVTVAGKSATARQSGSATLIPLPGGIDPNVPVEVRLRLGRPAVDGANPLVALPRVDAPVLKTEWYLHGDEKRILVPTGGTVEPPVPVLRPSGFSWMTRHGLAFLTMISAFAVLGVWLTRKKGILRFPGILALIASVLCAVAATVRALSAVRGTNPLQISLPALTEGEAVELTVRNSTLWEANLVWPGLVVLVLGIGVLVRSFMKKPPLGKSLCRVVSIFLVSIGLLLQRDGAGWFFGFLAVAIAVLLLFPQVRGGWKRFRKSRKQSRRSAREKPEQSGEGAGPATATLIIGAFLLLSGWGNASAQGLNPAGYESASEIRQEWKISSVNNSVSGDGTLLLSGKSGDSFLLLRHPAILTDFQGEGLRLTRQTLDGLGLCYVITIADDAPVESLVTDPFAVEPQNSGREVKDYEANFSFLLEVADVGAGVDVPTGTASVQEITATFDKAGWSYSSADAIKVTKIKSDGESSSARLLIAPGRKAKVLIKPEMRDLSSEVTQFFVENSNLYLPGPGVIDGRHRLEIRPAKGEVTQLEVTIPNGATVSEVTGPVGSWQFDAESGRLHLEVEPKQSTPFQINVKTQRSLGPLPADATLEPILVGGAEGQVGLIAIGFGPDAQPEKVESDTLSTVNLGDFDATLLPDESTILHRVYRFGEEGGSLSLRVAAVTPEVRVESKQVLSLGDERVVFGVNFNVAITRAGLFQLSFPLPDGFEVESLTGDALHHWAELSDEEQRRVVLHLNGKTMGVHSFALTLTSATPETADGWEIPQFTLTEASRQTGEMVVKPTTGIRLRTLTRQNVSEVDPRTLGDGAKGSLAFRLLQKDWNLTLGIEKLDPWLTSQVLHEVTLREGQTRTTLHLRLNVQNASVRSFQVHLPITTPEEARSLIATGKAVSDMVRVSPDSDLWEIRLKRRVLGDVDLRIEYERRGGREEEREALTPAAFPESRQTSYYFAVRSGGRLEVEATELPRGWQRADWNNVPQTLREAGNRNAPVITLRTVDPEEPLLIEAQRHSLAEALKLRVANGTLTSVLSPLGDQLTAVDLTMEVVQRSSLRVVLPPEGELFSIFVNGESVHSVRQGDAWQFYILPGADDRTATVRFVYSVEGTELAKQGLLSPELNVPLENIEWNVVAPKGFTLTDSDGNLELKEEQRWQQYDRKSYLSKTKGKRDEQAKQAAALLDQANVLLQAGEQSKARWAFNSVANQYALDAASNEDARVQLENLQTQQAVVGLNTRRQRLYLDQSAAGEGGAQNEQIDAGINENRILQKGDLNYRPQELSQLLVGISSEENEALTRIAAQLVKHQRSSIPAPQAITITLPEEGTIYTFKRTVQVAENAPLALDLNFAKDNRVSFLKAVALIALCLILAAGVGFAGRREAEAQ